MKGDIMKIKDNILLSVKDNDIKEGVFIIPNSVTSIGDFTFYGCTNLTEVEIPNSVTSIGDFTFYGCRNLTNIEIPNSVTSIGESAFYGCTNLTEVEIPNSVTSIGDFTFYGCRNLTNIEIPNSVTSIGECAFYGCTRLTSKNANYKAFSISNKRFMKLMCRDYFFQENEWSEEINKIIPCKKGYHYCTNLFEVFNYYSGLLNEDIAIYICEVGDKVVQTNTSKCVTNKIKPVKRLYRDDIVKILNGGDV